MPNMAAKGDKNTRLTDDVVFLAQCLYIDRSRGDIAAGDLQRQRQDIKDNIYKPKQHIKKIRGNMQPKHKHIINQRQHTTKA